LTELPPPCTKCSDKPSVYFRHYSGERLCSDCFIDSIKERVERTIARHDMLEHDSRIAIGVSGGKDSLGLLHVLTEIEQDFPNSELVAVSIDEGVECYRDEALSIARKACKDLDVEHVVLSFEDLFGLSIDDVASEPRELTPCSYCGVLRRRALNEGAKMVGADRLATAHNLDDMAQTALLNVLRGDINRLYMMSPGGKCLPGFVRRIKPYAEVPERESTLYAYLKGFDFQLKPCPHASDAMRNDMRSFLNRMELKRPGTKFIVYRTALKMSPQRDKLEFKGRCERCGEPTTGKICRTCQMLDEFTK